MRYRFLLNLVAFVILILCMLTVVFPVLKGFAVGSSPEVNLVHNISYHSKAQVLTLGFEVTELECVTRQNDTMFPSDYCKSVVSYSMLWGLSTTRGPNFYMRLGSYSIYVSISDSFVAQD